MSKTLNLVDILLTTGRNLVLMGRFTEALVPLTKLAGFRNLPLHVLNEVYALTADVHIQQENYKDARRQLAAAIALKPLEARHHYLMAVAIVEDDYADQSRAEMYFDRAVRIEADNAAYWLDFGSYLFTQGKATEGLKAICKAYAIDTSDAEIVGEVAQVLRREGLYDAATTKLRAALFENHGAQAFRQLWQQHQFALIHAQQQKKATRGDAQDRPVILPFTGRPAQGKFVDLGGRTIRIDQAEPLEAPKNKRPMPMKRPPRKG